VRIGFCMLLWTTSVGEEHRPLLEDLKATGYDGVEVPIFTPDPDELAAVGRMLDEVGLERTAISALGDPATDPLSPDPAVRAAAAALVDHRGGVGHRPGQRVGRAPPGPRPGRVAALVDRDRPVPGPGQRLQLPCPRG